MYINNLKQHIFFKPLQENMNQLFIVSGYATPNMTSWLIKNIERFSRVPIEINIIIGMVPYDGLSVSVHNGFKKLVSNPFPLSVKSLTCSYVCNIPVHSKLYIWGKDDIPLVAFSGSANFTQSAFSSYRKEIMDDCNPADALTYFYEIEKNCIYCNHAEVEEHIILYPVHDILDKENHPKRPFADSEIPSVTLSLLTRGGETGKKSGINWGQREGRNRNEAYIPLPAHIARSGFFPLGETHFTVATDDGHTLILRVEQENDKAITTPLSNAQLGEYLRNRIHAANGAYIWRSDLEKYGRTDITFYKLDEEKYYLDFSV